MEVLKYDSNGSLQWEYHWGNPDGGDTTGTAVAVDWQGAVYCAGVATGTGQLAPSHIVVLKLDSDHNPVWPASEDHSTSGYKFYNGAIMLTGTTYDFGDVAMAMKNEAGSLPTFAVTASTTQFKWRTVVFEAGLSIDGHERPTIKQGWPVDDFGTIVQTEDAPHSIAIYSDNTVFVTGHVLASENNGVFETVRYKAAGNYGTTDPQIWHDEFVDLPSKGGEGRDIKLDLDGNAYVTGLLLGAQTRTPEYATRKILKDADSNGNPVHGWTNDQFYDTAGDDEATSISLSFEVVSGSVVCYVLVTGMSEHTSTSSAYDVASLRYRGKDGNPEWTGAVRNVNAGDVARDVPFMPYAIATGQGNAYIAGKGYRSTSDYVLQGLTRGAAARFSPFYYDNSGTDEARCAAVGLAGLLYAQALQTEMGRISRP